MTNYLHLIAYAREARWTAIRITTAGDRLEFRVPDGAVNPYLLPASVIAACLEGIETKSGKLSVFQN